MAVHRLAWWVSRPLGGAPSCAVWLSFLLKASWKTNRIVILLEKWRKAQSPPLKQLLGARNQIRCGHHHPDDLNRCIKFCTDFNHLINKIEAKT